MPKDSAQADIMSWFDKLPMDDQIDLLRNPEQALSPGLIDRLNDKPGVLTQTRWAGSKDPAPLELSAVPRLRLRAIHNQLDAWWDHLAVHEQAYILQQRAGELDAIYAETVLAATGADLVVALVRDVRNRNSFRLPGMIRTYVEMQATSRPGAVG